MVTEKATSHCCHSSPRERKVATSPRNEWLLHCPRTRTATPSPLHVLGPRAVDVPCAPMLPSPALRLLCTHLCFRIWCCGCSTSIMPRALDPHLGELGKSRAAVTPQALTLQNPDPRLPHGHMHSRHQCHHHCEGAWEQIWHQGGSSLPGQLSWEKNIKVPSSHHR